MPIGNSTIAGTQSVQTNYTTGGDKVIKLAVKSLEGCESDTLYKTIHIYTRPVVDFSFTDSVCLGSPTNFTGILISATDPVVRWVWNIEGNAAATSQNTAYTFPIPGNNIVSFLATSNGSNGCFGLAVKSVFVVNKPVAYFKNPVICQSANNTFTDSSYTLDGTTINEWFWNLGSGGLSTQKNPVVTYPLDGSQVIKLVVHNAKGCQSDTLAKTIAVSAKPIANFGYSTPVCAGLQVQFSDSSKATTGTVNKWSWVYNGTEFSMAQNPANTFAAGAQTVKLVATSDMGCVSDTLPKTFVVAPIPDVTISFKDACKNSLVNFTAVDNSGTVTDWKWAFGDGATALTQNTQHTYTANGTYNVKLIASASNGCFSNSLTKDINIYGTNAFAGNDTIAAAGQPIQLNATGGLSYTWSPGNLLSNPTIANPVTALTASQLFTVKAFTPEGCESYDDVLVKIYKGPDIYLPNAFTPNGDGLNDFFKGTPVGIKQFNYLKVFNRWGQLIFSTGDYNKAWDGTWQGVQQASGVYVVLANGIDFKGNVIDKRATVLLIR
ncbi:MAG: PKD domain-containing protein [Ferruginibacter sp.]